MNIKKAEEALEKVAQINGVSSEEVRREIEIAIAMARKNPDPEIQTFWASIPYKGAFPTPEEVILHIAKVVSTS